jgi:hypothetical protein
VSQPRKPKKEYTLQEDTMITAQAAVNIVRSTRPDVDPVPFVAALLEGYTRRVQTKYSATSTQPAPSRPRQRQGKSKQQEMGENGHG